MSEYTGSISNGENSESRIPGTDALLAFLTGRIDNPSTENGFLETLIEISRAKAGIITHYLPDKQQPFDIEFYSADPADRLSFLYANSLTQDFIAEIFPHPSASFKKATAAITIETGISGHDDIYMAAAVYSGRMVSVAFLFSLGTVEFRRTAASDFIRISTPYLHQLSVDQQNRIARKETLLSARKIEDQFEDMFNNSMDAIVFCDGNGNIIEVNRAGLSMSGNNLREDLLGKPVSEFYHSDIPVEKLLDQLKVKPHIKDLELMFVHEGMNDHYGLASVVAHYDNSGNIHRIYLVIKDITVRIQRDAEIMKANTELEILTRELQHKQEQIIQQEKLASIGQLAAGVAHEINNPLAFIQSNLEVLRDDITPGFPKDALRDEMSDILEETMEGIHRIGRIVRSLKDFSHVDPEEVISYVKVKDMIENTLSIARNHYKYSASVELDLKYEGPIGCYRDKLHQVFLNMVINSAQAISSQERDSLGIIRISSVMHVGRVHIVFEDDGPGVAQETANKVFDPFFTTKEVGKGTGLGLSVSRDIVVKLHGGEISCQESELGGARFELIIPQDISKIPDLE